MDEIGSHFWLNNDDQIILEKADKQYKRFIDNANQKFVFLGRTAIDLVLSDIENELKRPIKTAYLPSYCCESMLMPFHNRRIKVEFYDVNWEEGNIEWDIQLNKNYDVFFSVNYFGINQPAHLFTEIKSSGSIIIEDCTHNWLDDKNFNSNSDYLIVSLRKWMNIVSGGLAIKSSGAFSEYLLDYPAEDVISTQISAMLLKGKYLKRQKSEDKTHFLSLYNIFSERIEKDYANRRIDNYSEKLLQSMDFTNIKKRRCENANALHKALKGIEKLCLFPQLKTGTVPLFVPIIVSEEIRDELHEYLIKNQIFCPLHWPKPNSYCNSNLYQREISLICDQRYKVDDMNRIVSVIRKFFEEGN